MKQLYKKYIHKGIVNGVVLMSLIINGCVDFVQIDPPRTDLVKSTVFSNEATAHAAMVDIYYGLRSAGFASGNSSSITYYATYSADEQINYSTQPNQEFNDNELTSGNPFILNLWSEMYNAIYKSNAIIEGVNTSQNLSETVKLQLDGEAKFIRAFCYFYLVNLFGDVPLVRSTDYQINAKIGRTQAQSVYDQIIQDLKDAQNHLPQDYAFASNERVRANHGAATALLARVYLMIQNWEAAEAEATKLIENTQQYALMSDLNDVFSKNNTEAIFQLHNTFRPGEWSTFRVSAAIGFPHNGVLRPEFESNFQPEDQRRNKWLRTIQIGESTYLFPGKYKNATTSADYSTLFRLAEIFLIRSEARAHQDNLTGSQEDLNVIRNRAGLSNTAASDKESLLIAIEHERVLELFTEQGLRWLDLKRTNRADLVLSPLKGNNWQPTDVLYPLPEYELLNNPALFGAQNPGY